MYVLTKREKMMIGSAVCAVVFGCFYMFVYEPKEKEASRLQEEIRTIANEIGMIAKEIPDLEKSEKEVSQAQKRLSMAKKNAPGKQQVQQVLQHLARDASKLDMDVISLEIAGESESSPEESSYEKLTMVMDIQCPYRNLGLYLGELSDVAGLVGVDELQIIRNEKIFPKLQVRLTLTTFATKT